MKDFTDQLIDLILENEKNRIDKIMQYTMEQVSKDFASEMMRYLDMYYDNYDPTSYVRVYGKRGKYMSGEKPKPGQVSLHAAVSRDGGSSLERAEGTLQPAGRVSYIGGIEFDESSFNRNKMKHIGKGISEWDIVENFLYAGEGVGKGDWRAVTDYNAPSPDELMGNYMGRYFSRFYSHFKNAIRKFK
jgi:hypothetical protein